MRYYLYALLSLLIWSQSDVAFCSQPSDLPLYKILFYNQIPEYSPQKLDVTKYPETVRDRLIEYQKRAKHFKSKFASSKGPWEQRMAFNKKIQVEQGIVSLISTKGIEDIAYQFAKNAPMSYEWEGNSDGPLNEAEFAEDYLHQNPNTPIKPYLILFLVHHYRIAFECLDFEKKFEAQANAAGKYQQYLKMARDEKDPLIGLIAADIDKESYIYIKTQKHP